MLVRPRALVLSCFLVPLATGCTLWYLASDPYDGLGGDGGAGSADSSSDASAGDADYSSECGSLRTIDNCGACGRTCDHDAGCIPSTGKNPFNCGATLVTLPQVPIAIATHDDVLYTLDQRGDVWTCDGACDSIGELVTSGAVQNMGSIAVSDQGAFWVVTGDGIHSIELDGGVLSPVVNDSNAVSISAGGPRIAWTNGASIRWQSVQNGPGFTSGGLNNPFADADTDNVALVQDGGFIAWSTGENQAHYTQLFRDGGSQNRDFPTLDTSTNLRIAADDENVFLTWRNKSADGAIEWLPNGGTDFITLDHISAAAKPAAVLVLYPSARRFVNFLWKFRVYVA